MISPMVENCMIRKETPDVTLCFASVSSCGTGFSFVGCSNVSAPINSPWSRRQENLTVDKVHGAQRRGKLSAIVRTRFNSRQLIEIVLLLPATIVLVPALPFGIVFTVLTLSAGFVVGLLGGSHAFLKEINSSNEVAALLLMMLAAGMSLVSLWLSVLRDRAWVYEKPRRKSFIVSGLAAGLAAAGYWLSRLPIPPHDSGELRALVFWSLILAGPTLVALRQLWILLRSGPDRVSRSTTARQV